MFSYWNGDRVTAGRCDSKRENLLTRTFLVEFFAYDPHPARSLAVLFPPFPKRLKPVAPLAHLNWRQFVKFASASLGFGVYALNRIRDHPRPSVVTNQLAVGFFLRVSQRRNLAGTGSGYHYGPQLMRKWFLQIHLYAGLLCSAYLIIFGYTSLNFNHRFGFAQPKESTVAWEQALPLEPAQDNVKAAESVRDALGLMGWLPRQKMRRDHAGNLQFDLERPGKSYTIHALVKEGRVKVEERRKGFWPVVNSLHALMAVPNSKFVPFWGWYTELCAWVVLFGAVSGVYLWVVSARERRVGLWTLITATTVSLGLMVYVVWRG
jgi:hypothetical protein